MKIKMGNDEFILYIRKNSLGRDKGNAELGKKIWKWLKKNSPDARIVEQDQPCHWGDTGQFINENDLPKTATQFHFDRAILPRLYDYLETL